MFRRRHIPENVLRQLIREGREDALIALLRMHYVKARNHLLRLDLDEKIIEQLIEKATVATWMHYAAHPEDETPLRERLFHYIRHPDRLNPPEDFRHFQSIIRVLRRIFDPVCWQLLMWHYGDGRDADNVAHLAGQSPEKTRSDLKKCMERFRYVASPFLASGIGPASPATQERIRQYLAGMLSAEETLLLEAEAATHLPLHKRIAVEKKMRALLRYAREKALQHYLQRHTTRRLTGNIWGRRWTFISAIIIGLALLAMWWLSDASDAPPPPSLLDQDFTPPTHATPSSEIGFRRLIDLKRKAAHYQAKKVGTQVFHLLFFPQDSFAVRREKNALLLYGISPDARPTLALKDSTLFVHLNDSLFRFPL